MTTDEIKVLRVRGHLVNPVGTRDMTRLLLAAAADLSDADRVRLDDLALDLRDDLVADRVQAWDEAGRQRLAALAEGPPHPLLLRLAVLFAGVYTSWMKQQRGGPPPMSLLAGDRAFDKDKRRHAADWMVWATDQVDALRLLSPPLRDALLGGAAAAGEGFLADLAALSAALPADDYERRPGPAALLDLSAEQCRELASWATELFEGDVPVGVAIAADLLKELACVAPAALSDDLQARVAEAVGAGKSVHGVVFRNGGPMTSEALLAERPEGENSNNRLLTELAWLGDDAAQAKFHAWRSAGETLPGTFVPADQYTFEAGWELTPDGGRRDLCSDTCYLLVPADEGTPAADPAVAVSTPRRDKCGHCKLPMWNLIDVDLSDSRFAFLGVDAARLTIPFCPACFDWTYAKFAADGKAKWHKDTPEPEEEGEEEVELNERPLVLGRTARSPVEPLVIDRPSCIGGHPEWIDDAEYPPCPKCDEPMRFVAQVALGPLGADGSAYAFVCAACRTTAVNMRCT